MRWKLLLVASLLSTFTGAGASLLLSYLLFGPAGAASGWAALLTLVLPLGAIIYASIFVYRHTARRRPLQAIITALLAALLTLAVLAAASIYFGRGLAPASSAVPPLKFIH